MHGPPFELRPISTFKDVFIICLKLHVLSYSKILLKL